VVAGLPRPAAALHHPAGSFAPARMARRASAHQSALLAALAAAEQAVAADTSAGALRAPP